MSRANFAVYVGRTVWGTFVNRDDAVAKATRELACAFTVKAIDSRVRIARMSVSASHRAEEAWLRARPSFDLDVGVF
jgi:hypothetical protein